MEDRNLEVFKTFLDSDARFVGNAIFTGPEEVAAAWKIFFLEDGPMIKWRPQFVEVLEDETLALTRGPYRITGEDADGHVLERWGTFNSVWRKHSDGQWRVVFDAGSEAATPPDEDTQALLEQDVDCQ